MYTEEEIQEINSQWEELTFEATYREMEASLQQRENLTRYYTHLVSQHKHRLIETIIAAYVGSLRQTKNSEMTKDETRSAEDIFLDDSPMMQDFDAAYQEYREGGEEALTEWMDKYLNEIKDTLLYQNAVALADLGIKRPETAAYFRKTTIDHFERFFWKKEKT